MSHNRIHFFDTTLRDGEQSPGCSMTHHEKLRLAHSLAALGVDILEAGFAIASDGDFAAIRNIARMCAARSIASLARARREDIEAPPMPSRRRSARGFTSSSPAPTSISSTS